MGRIRKGRDTEVVTRIDGVVLGGLGVGLVLAVLNGLRSAEAKVAIAPKPPDPARVEQQQAASIQSSMKEDIAIFLTGLDRLRHNDEEVLPSLREVSRRLCEVHDRCDFRDMLGYFVGLTPDQRANGLAGEANFHDLRTRVLEAAEKNLPLEQWPNLRTQLIEGLRKLVLPDRSAGDCVPGAKALGLCALPRGGVDRERLRIADFTTRGLALDRAGGRTRQHCSLQACGSGDPAAGAQMGPGATRGCTRILGLST